MAFVESVRDEYSLSTALSAAELPKSTRYYQQKHKVSRDEKYAHLRPLLEEIARQHPEYGYRRTLVLTTKKWFSRSLREPARGVGLIIESLWFTEAFSSCLTRLCFPVLFSSRLTR